VILYNLQHSGAIRGPDADRMPAGRRVGPKICRDPLAIINLYLHLLDASISGPGDPANGDAAIFDVIRLDRDPAE
jgi:hypothetical protein